jgi:hypothetical protein
MIPSPVFLLTLLWFHLTGGHGISGTRRGENLFSCHYGPALKNPIAVVSYHTDACYIEILLLTDTRYQSASQPLPNNRHLDWLYRFSGYIDILKHLLYPSYIVITSAYSLYMMMMMMMYCCTLTISMPYIN